MVKIERVPVRRFVPARLADRAPAERSALLDRLYDVFCEGYAGVSRAAFETDFIRHCVVLNIAYAADGRLAGFIGVTRDLHEVEGRRTMVFGSLVFIGLEFRGGVRSVAFGLREALRYKLRHPLIELAFVTVASTPATYELNARSAPRIYPARGVVTPPHFRALIDSVIERRGLRVVSRTPHLVARDMIPVHRDRLEHSTSLSVSERVAYYTEIAPNWDVGVSPLICVPLALRDVIGALWMVRSASRDRRRRLAERRAQPVTALAEGWAQAEQAEMTARAPLPHTGWP